MSGNEILLISTLLVPLLGSVVVLLARLLGPRAPGYAALLVSLGTLGVGIGLLPAVRHSGYVALTIPWLRLFRASFALRADALSLIVLLTMAAVTTLAVVYSLGYYEEGRRRTAPFYALITVFLCGMIGVTVSSETILFYLFWEMMLVPSFALVTFWGKGLYTMESGLKYFIYTHIGAVAMLGAILWIYTATGITDIYAIKQGIAGLPRGTMEILAGLFIFAFAVKMAIFPFHSWLPGTYDDAPLAVTIIIAGAMITAGIYGMIRFPFTLFPREIIREFQTPLMVLAVITQLYGGIMALTTKRLRRILAYSSVSQMGYVLFGIMAGNALGVGGAVFHLLNHALIKVLLFMAIGSVITRTAKQKSSELGGLAAKMPVTAWAAAIGALAIAGTPPFNGFQSEWMIFAGGFGSRHWVLSLISLVAGVLTAAYALLLVRRIFFGQPAPGTAETRESPAWMLGPMIAACLAIVLVGILPGPFLAWVNAALKAVGELRTLQALRRRRAPIN